MAQKLKFGNGTWATKEGSTLAYNDENNNYKPLPFTTTRNSIGTRVNKEGLIEVVGNDIPRIDYKDSAEGALLLEPQSSNLITYSEDFSQSDWTKDNATITQNSTISPDGMMNASLMLSTNSNTRISDAIAVPNTFYVSVFVKYIDQQFIQIYSGASGSYYINFDIKNKLHQGGSLVSEVKFEEYGNGWLRLGAKFSGAGAASSTIRLGFSQSLTSSYGNSGGNTSSGSSVYIWGAQLEEESYPTSYIPTSGSSVTRLADTANGSGNSEVFNDSEGVLFANISAFVGAGGGTRRIEVSNSVNASQYVRLQIANGDGSLYGTVDNGTQQFLFNATSFDATLSNKISLKYKQNDFSLFLNGFEVGSSNVGNTFANGILTQANFSSTLSEFYGKTKELGYYDTALTDLELETLTSYRSLNELVTELNLNTL